MLYRRFGRTNLQMPVFSCGGMRYQASWNSTELDKITPNGQANLEACIHRSLELGINHIETARGYGTSEYQLGRFLRDLPREKMIVQTKVAPANTPQEFLDTFETSMSNLRLDYVDLLGIHGINNAELLEQTVRPGGCLEAAEKLQKEGRVRHIGFSTHASLPVILKTIQTGRFSYVNLHWYYIAQVNWPAVEAARKLDMGVFIISPTDKGGMLHKPSAKLVDLCHPLSPMVFNDLFCLARPEVHTLSIGAARPSDFDEHLKTLPLLEKADEILPPIVARLDGELEKTFGRSWMENYLQGIPRWQDLPGQLNVRMMLRLRNLLAAFDLQEFVKMRYNLIGNGGHWFPGEHWGKTEGVNLADLSAALKTSPYGAVIPTLLADLHAQVGGEAKKRLSQAD